MKRYDEAKKLLLEAQKGVKDEVLPELAQVAAASGDGKSALAFYKKSLDDDVKQLPKGHPDLVADRMNYGETLLELGQFEEARAQLAQAYAVLDNDMSPFEVADVSFDYAQALEKTRPDEHAKALQMARAARQIYVENAPKTERFQEAIRRIEDWLNQSK